MESPQSVAAERGRDSAEFLHEKIDRYGVARSQALEIVPYLQSLRGAGDYEATQALLKVQGCGNLLRFDHYLEVDKVRLGWASFCKQHLLCPLCAIRRGGKLLQGYLVKLEAVRREHPGAVLALVGLTVKNGSDLGERYCHLKRAVVRLLKRRLEVRVCSSFRTLISAVWSYEVTNIGNGWHPHVHMAAVFPAGTDLEAVARGLQAEWRAITGDSYIVDVTPFYAHQDPARAFCEVFKYALKFGDLSVEDRWLAARALRNRRLVASCGAFRGVVIPDDLLDEPLTGPVAMYWYRFLGKRYGLTKVDGWSDDTSADSSV